MVEDLDILVQILEVYLVDNFFSATLRFSQPNVCYQVLSQFKGELCGVVLHTCQILKAC